MSKPNNKGKEKDKKSGEATLQFQKMYQAQKRQLYVKDKTIKELQFQVSNLKKQNHSMNERIHNFNTDAENKIEYLKLNNETLQQRLKQVYRAKGEAQIKCSSVQLKLRKLQKSYSELEAQKEKQLDQMQRKISMQIQKYQNHVNEYQTSINEYKLITSQNINLKGDLQKQIYQKQKTAADLERQKIQALDGLKQQMTDKIHEMKKNLLTMRRQQMATNVRLTVLQNNQLVQQLEFQSKNTQKILEKNVQLQQKIKYLSKQIQIQRDIQDQIANRTNISKNIIKKLHARNEQLQSQVENYERKLNQARIEEQQRATKRSEQKYIKLIKDLEAKLSKAQLQLKMMRQKFAALQSENAINIIQIQTHKSQSEDLANIILRYYDEVLKGSVTVDEGQYVYDLTRLKELDINKWKKQDCEVTVKILLNLIKSKINTKNINVPYLKKVLVINQQPKKNKFSSYSCYNSIDNCKSQSSNLNQKFNNFQSNLSQNKKRNLSELGKRIIGSNNIQKENQISSGKIVSSNKFRQWGKPIVLPPCFSVQRFYKRK